MRRRALQFTNRAATPCMTQLSAEWTDYLTQRTNFPHLKADTVRRRRLARDALRTASRRLTMASESRRRPSPKSASPRSRCRPRTRRLGGADDVGHAVCDLLDLGEFVQKGSRADEIRHDGRPVAACGAGRRWICRLFVHGRSGDGPSAGTGGAGGGGLAHSSFTRTTT